MTFRSDLHPRLEVRHLTPMIALEQTGSVTRAAELLGITQSALSRRIQEAEQRLGTTLYLRSQKRLRLTAAGACLLENAKRILAALERAESDTIQMPAGPRHVVRVGAGAYTCFHWLPCFLDCLWQAAPGLDVVIAPESAELPQDAVLRNAIDVGIVPGPITDRGIHAVKLFEDELVAIVAPRHALADRRYLVAEDFADQTYITYGPTYLLGFESDRVLRPAKVWPRRLLKIAYVDGIIAMVAAGHGISVLSRWAVSPAVEDGAIQAIPVTRSGLPITWSAVVRRHDGREGAAHSFADHLAAWTSGSSKAFSIGFQPQTNEQRSPAKRASRVKL